MSAYCILRGKLTLFMLSDSVCMIPDAGPLLEIFLWSLLQSDLLRFAFCASPDPPSRSIQMPF